LKSYVRTSVISVSITLPGIPKMLTNIIVKKFTPIWKENSPPD